jgi:hypothetical protein
VRDKAKPGEKAQFIFINEHFEPGFNAVSRRMRFSADCFTHQSGDRPYVCYFLVAAGDNGDGH